MDNIIQYFSDKPSVMVGGVFSNKKECLAIKKAKKANIKTVCFTKKELINGNLLKPLKEINPTLIILAGFLMKIPESIINAFPNKIVNIHPALLPNYGGKGMYGNHIHKAVLNAQEEKTGITIHYVNEEYDKGAVIEQVETLIDSDETLTTLKKKISDLEKEYFPKVIHSLL